MTEQPASSEARVAKLEGIVEEQRRTSEDFKDQMSILVSKLLERDSNVEQSFETGEAFEPASLHLEQGRRPGTSSSPSVKCDVILTLPIVPGDERSSGLAIWSDCQHVRMIVRATLPYCSQRDSASCLARLVPLVTSGRLILDC